MKFSIVLQCKGNVDSFDFECLIESVGIALDYPAILGTAMQVNESRMIVQDIDGNEIATLIRHE